MQTEMTTTYNQAPPVERPLSLLDQLEVRKVEQAQRYMPVMQPEQVIDRMDQLARIKSHLREGITQDYAVIPGTDRPVLLKPGAEKICAAFGYVPTYELLPGSIEDWAGERYGEPLFYYHVRCTLTRDGVAVGQGTGSCSTWESKYRYRNGQRVCPQCGKATLIKGKPEFERDPTYIARGAWICFEKKGGCGAKYYGDDQSIVGQEVGQVPNPNIADVVNTVQKIADKRSYVAAVLSATGASQFFTQDMEDQAPADPTVEQVRRQANQVDTGGAPVGTQQAQDNVRDRKVAEMRQAASSRRRHDEMADADVPDGDGRAAVSYAQREDDDELPMDFKAMMACFESEKDRIGEVTYCAVLNAVKPGCKHANQLGNRTNFVKAYSAMRARADQRRGVSA